MAALLLPSVSVAQEVGQITVPIQVTGQDIQIYLTAIRLAAAQCGADKELACQIGLNEKAQALKLQEAFTVYNTALMKKQEEDAKKSQPKK